MEKMKMQTADVANENFLKLAALFPNAVTETIDENGEVVRAIDKDILMQEIVMLDKKETGESLFDKLAVCGAELIVKALAEIEKGSLTQIKQDDAKSTYAKMLRKELGRLDFSQDAVVLERKIRGLNSWPSAYTLFKGKTLKIWDADVIDKNSLSFKSYGEVCEVGKESFTIQTGNGMLKINEVQLEGKKRMDVKSFLLGNTIENGMIFPN